MGAASGGYNTVAGQTVTPERAGTPPPQSQYIRGWARFLDHSLTRWRTARGRVLTIGVETPSAKSRSCDFTSAGRPRLHSWRRPSGTFESWDSNPEPPAHESCAGSCPTGAPREKCCLCCLRGEGEACTCRHGMAMGVLCGAGCAGSPNSTQQATTLHTSINQLQ